MDKIDNNHQEKQFKYYLGNINNQSLKVYIEERVIKEIRWYEKKSDSNKLWYRTLMIASILMSGSIPILTLMLNSSKGIEIKIAIAILSSAITGISAVIGLYNYHELWIQYRTNCEMLKSILYRFFTKSNEFKELNDIESQDMLITSCENYIMKEFEKWGSIRMAQINKSNMKQRV